jgi:hypothetical protein
LSFVPSSWQGLMLLVVVSLASMHQAWVDLK